MDRQPPRRREKPPKPTRYAGLVTCLRCDTVFESWDRRQNRLCDACRLAIAAQPSDEPSYTIPTSPRRPHGPDDR
jgi:hypothetical protein